MKKTMANVELIMPKMGESIMEATILKWLKSEGDSVEADEPVLEIATDKVDSEVPAPEDGVVAKILFEEGDVVEVGKPIAIINTEGDASAADTGGAAEETTKTAAAETGGDTAVQTKPAPPKESKTEAPAAGNNGHSSNGNGRFYSPLVLNIARKEGVSMSELENLPGSGMNDRVTKKDILAYLENRGEAPAQSAEQPAAKETPKRPETAVAAAQKPEPAAPPVSRAGNVEIEEMDRMRKLIADHMVMSKRVSPHVTSFVEADVTNLVKWREKAKKVYMEREGEKITFTPIFIEAILKALKDFPKVNASVDGYDVIIRKDLNIGMATAMPNGNLIVPVIKNADQLNMVGLTKKVNDLANRARNNNLKPEEIEGGTFTVTNVGTFGNVMGTPIISQPQVAIMATGAIKKKPVVIETEVGDTIAIRHMMFLSLSYDHRIVDGMMGGSFLRRVADYLEAFDLNREI